MKRSVVVELMGAAYNAAVQQVGSCCWPTASFERGDTQGETRGRDAAQGEVQTAIQQLWSCCPAAFAGENHLEQFLEGLSACLSACVLECCLC